VQTKVHIENPESTGNCNIFLRLGAWQGSQAAVIHFMEGDLQLSEP